MAFRRSSVRSRLAPPFLSPNEGIVMRKSDLNQDVVHREMLKLSDLDSKLVSDLSGMFGKWFEADHCDKDDD